MLYRIYKLEPKARGDANIVKYYSHAIRLILLLGEKIERKVYCKSDEFISDIQLLIKYLA